MNKTDKIFKNLSEISLYLSVPLFLITIISGLLFINEINIRNSWLINKTFDTPTFIVLASYLVTTARNSLYNKNQPNKLIDYSLLIFIFIFSAFLITFDVLIPNQIP